MSGGQRGRRGRRDIERTVLNKRDVAGNTNATGNRIIASIALVLRAITKENTGCGLSREFGALTRRKKDITQATKNTMVVITWRVTKQTLTRTATLEKGRWLKVDKVDCSGYSLSPKLWRHMRCDEGASRLNDMTVLPFSSAIL